MDDNFFELDIKSMLRLFWHGKYVFVIFAAFSLALSFLIIAYTPHKFKAEAVIEVDDEKASRGPASGLVSMAESLNLIMPQIEAGGKDTLIPKILGREFLSALVREYKIAQELNFKFENFR